jgi:hypothetical protein
VRCGNNLMIWWTPVLCPCSEGSKPASAAQICNEGMDSMFSIEGVGCNRPRVEDLRCGVNDSGRAAAGRIRDAGGFNVYMIYGIRFWGGFSCTKWASPPLICDQKRQT